MLPNAENDLQTDGVYGCWCIIAFVNVLIMGMGEAVVLGKRANRAAKGALCCVMYYLYCLEGV